LLVTYKEHYLFSWEDFKRFNGTNNWGLASLGYIGCEEAGSSMMEKLECKLSQEEIELEEEIVMMVAREWEKGNTEEVKQLLREVLKDIQTGSKPGYSCKNWSVKWNSVMGNNNQYPSCEKRRDSQ
jgi:hypothetical protein